MGRPPQHTKCIHPKMFKKNPKQNSAPVCKSLTWRNMSAFHVWCETSQWRCSQVQTNNRKWQQDAVVVKAKWMHKSRTHSAAGASLWSYVPDNLMNVIIPQLFSLIFLLHQLVSKLVFLSSAAGQLASSECSKRSIILLQNWLIGAEETLSHRGPPIGFAKWCPISSGKISTSKACHWKSPFGGHLKPSASVKGGEMGLALRLQNTSSRKKLPL